MFSSVFRVRDLREARLAQAPTAQGAAPTPAKEYVVKVIRNNEIMYKAGLRGTPIALKHSTGCSAGLILRMFYVVFGRGAISGAAGAERPRAAAPLHSLDFAL